MAATKRKNPPAPTAPAPEPAAPEPVAAAPASAPEREPLLAGFMTQPELLDELNKVIKVDKRTFQRWEQMRVGPPRVTLGRGRTILYARDSVLAWLRANESRFQRSRSR
jgi:hypothetical protein